jgi:hypothetical protein
LFQHLLAGDVEGGVQRLSVETMAMADQAPQATLLNGVGKLQKNGSTVWYCGRGHGSFPPEFRIRNSGSGIPEQINLALE